MAAAAADTFEIGPEPRLRGEGAGEGPPVMLCHGITATRRYVVHGSRVLERAGHRAISYDARGHGDSDPAPVGEDYGYQYLVADLARVADAEVGEGTFALAGHSMGAHTAVAYALRHPQRLSALVLVGPAYMGEISAQSVAYWEGLADSLEGGGVDGFVAYIGEHQEIDPAWRDSVLRFTRERILLHRHPEAVVAALRQVPRERPFESLEELGALEMPALVVASHDDADPGHPFAVAEAYAEALPDARLISEQPGDSPLAWQGGRLSREIAGFLESLSSAA